MGQVLEVWDESTFSKSKRNSPKDTLIFFFFFLATYCICFLTLQALPVSSYPPHPRLHHPCMHKYFMDLPLCYGRCSSRYEKESNMKVLTSLARASKSAFWIFLTETRSEKFILLSINNQNESFVKWYLTLPRVVCCVIFYLIKEESTATHWMSFANTCGLHLAILKRVSQTVNTEG